MSGRTGDGMGWGRAALIALATAAVSFVLLVWVPNVIVTRATSLVHPARVALATAAFAIALVAIAAALHVLQKRNVL